jgi:3-deoxy-manno-octulosonate cytidylyltransferase (CMP-KDO synthetase)
VFRISEPAQLHDPNIVKAVVNPQGQALYFSRSLVPFPRKPGPEGLWAWRHLGVYLYQREFLLQYHQWPQTPLEQTEQLEQLRILENGVPILCVQAHFDGVGVDVPEDVPKAESLLQSLAQQKEKR